MGTRILKYLTPIFLVGVFFSCDTEEIIPDVDTGDLSVKVEGQTFDVSTISAKLFISEPDSTLEITATDKEGSIITIAFNSLESKTFTTTGETSPEITFNYKQSVGSGVTISEEGDIGTLTLISHDPISKHITGTFNFETENYEVTGGSFDKLGYE